MQDDTTYDDTLTKLLEYRSATRYSFRPDEADAIL